MRVQELNRPSIHWGVIAVALFFFYPAGIVLWFVRYFSHAKRNHLRAKDLKLASNIAFITGAIVIGGGLALLLSDPESKDSVGPFVITVAIFFGVPGLFFSWRAGLNKANLAARYEQYARLLSEQQTLTVKELAAHTRVSVPNVRQDIAYLVDSGLWDNVRLAGDQIFVLSDQAVNPSEPAVPIKTPRETPSDDGSWTAHNEAAAAAASGGPVAVTCSGCGAKATIYPGRTSDCEFCGNTLTVS